MIRLKEGRNMISKKTVETAMYQAMKLAATRIPPDVQFRLDSVMSEETDPLAREHMRACFENFAIASESEGLVCGDTGFPLYFIRMNPQIGIDGGVPVIYESAISATRRATDDAFLRPTMVDPLTRENPGQNVGPGMPKVEIKYDSTVDGIDILAAPKGGGSEIFGTFYRMLFPSDGEAGICKFVLESICDACYSGKICPPAIVGVGIGGTADLCMKLAKEAALLRPVGKNNNDPKVAALENKLLMGVRKLGIGPMGAKGINVVMGLHIETALTHTAALPVAVNAQCLVGRRWRAVISSSGDVEYTGEIE